MPRPVEILAPPGVAGADASAASAQAAVSWDDERILRERRAARGWDGGEIRSRLEHPAWRAVARLLRGESGGLLVLTPAAEPDAETREAMALLEPLPGMALAPLRLAFASSGALEFALLAAPPAAPHALAQAIATAAAVIAQHWEQEMHPVLVDFSLAAGSAPFAAALAAVRARGEARAAELYSPFFYRHGVLKAESLLAAILNVSPASPLIAIPGLGGGWLPSAETAPATGAWLAGAEKPLAWLPVSAGPAPRARTLAALRLLAAPPAD